LTVFDEADSAEFYEPMFRGQKNATLQFKGILFMGPRFYVTDGERKEIVMDVLSFEKDKLVLKNKAGDIKTLIKKVNK